MFRFLSRFLSTPLPRGWKERGSGLHEWAKLYGKEEVPRVQKFLKVMCDGFLLSADDAVWLFPEDKPSEIYRNYYQGKRRNGPDTLEWESFTLDLESEFKIKISEDIGSMSLSQIYDFLRRGRLTN